MKDTVTSKKLIFSLADNSSLPAEQACYMFLWTWSIGMKMASSPFRLPLIYEEERLWNVNYRLGHAIAAFSPLSVPAKENRTFSELSWS